MTKNQKIYMYVGIALAVIAIGVYLWSRSKKQNAQTDVMPTPNPGNGKPIQLGAADFIPTTSNPAPNTPPNQISVAPVTNAIQLSGNSANASPLATAGIPPVVPNNKGIPIGSLSSTAASSVSSGGPIKKASFL